MANKFSWFFQLLSEDQLVDQRRLIKLFPVSKESQENIDMAQLPISFKPFPSWPRQKVSIEENTNGLMV